MDTVSHHVISKCDDGNHRLYQQYRSTDQDMEVEINGDHEIKAGDREIKEGINGINGRHNADMLQIVRRHHYSHHRNEIREYHSGKTKEPNFKIRIQQHHVYKDNDN